MTGEQPKQKEGNEYERRESKCSLAITAAQTEVSPSQESTTKQHRYENCEQKDDYGSALDASQRRLRFRRAIPRVDDLKIDRLAIIQSGFDTYF